MQVAAWPAQTLVPLDEALAWIEREAASTGLGRIVRVTPQKLTNRSVVLEVVASGGAAFFKAGIGLARHEAPLTAFLNHRYPAHFTAIVASDLGRGWMLTRAAQGPTLMVTRHVGSWQRAFETLGRIQCRFARSVDELFEVGCGEQTLASLASRVDTFVQRWGEEETVTAAQRHALNLAAPRWKALCRRGTPGVPGATLDHIDLHPHNIIVTTSGPVFLDWDGGAIGHPFWSALVLLGYAERLVPEIAVARHELRAAYLRPWTEFLPMSDLVSAFEQVRPLASLKYAFGLLHLLASGEAEQDAATLRATIRDCLDGALAAFNPEPA